MPRYIPVTEPEALEHFRCFIRRSFIAGAINMALCLAFIIFAPRATVPRYAFLACVVLFCLLTLGIALIPLGFKKTYANLGYTWMNKPVLPHPLSVQYHLASLASTMPLMGMMFAHQESGFRSLVYFCMFPCAYLGGILFAHGWKGRQPAEPSCPACAYPIDPDTLPGVCPECAKQLASINALTRAPIVRRPSYMWVGGVLAVSCIALFFLSLFSPGTIAAGLPRPARLALAASDRNVFERIDTATLSETERTELIESILDARITERSYRMGAQLEWLATQLGAGALTPEQAERLVFDDAQLTIMQRPVSGGLREVTIRLDLPRVRGLNPLMFCHTFPGDPFPPALDPNEPNHDTWRLTLPFDKRDRYSPRDDTPPRHRVPTITVPADQAFTAKARIVVFVAPPGTRSLAIDWHDDGTYTITPPPLIHKEFNAEREIAAP